MSGFLDAIRGVIGDGWGEDVQREGVRPDYGLSTATGIEPREKSSYERTLQSGEKRSSGDLQGMLAEVIMAAGSGALPGAGPRAAGAQAPGRTLLRNVETPMGPGKITRADGKIVVKDPISGRHLYTVSPSEYRAYRRDGAFKKSDLGTDIDVYHGTTAAKIRPEPGLHVGTPEQANFRAMLGTDPITKEVREGAKVFPLKMTPRKMVDINDLGHAMSFPGNKAAELMKVGAITKAEHDAVLQSPSSTKALNDLLLAKKIDALRYGNQWEGEGKSYEVINPNILRGAYQR